MSRGYPVSKVARLTYKCSKKEVGEPDKGLPCYDAPCFSSFLQLSNISHSETIEQIHLNHHDCKNKDGQKRQGHKWEAGRGVNRKVWVFYFSDEHPKSFEEGGERSVEEEELTVVLGFNPDKTDRVVAGYWLQKYVKAGYYKMSDIRVLNLQLVKDCSLFRTEWYIYVVKKFSPPAVWGRRPLKIPQWTARKRP